MPIINNASLKRKSEDSEPSADRDLSQISMQDFLLSFNNEITKRLDKIDQRLDTITETCDSLEGKIEQITAVLNNRDEGKEGCSVYRVVEFYYFQLHGDVENRIFGFDSIVNMRPDPLRKLQFMIQHDLCLVSNNLGSDNSCLSSGAPYSSVIPFNSGVTVITLNNADAYPDGSWLGDESKPELRVRCCISPTQLLYINTTCTTAEKMALVLLDHLFDREIQACSNISGTGKYKKDRLDPLLIYGIQCHLISQFRITEDDWIRIKQNIDSKCRTAFHKKRKSIAVSAEESPSVLQSPQNSNCADLSQCTDQPTPSDIDNTSTKTDDIETKLPLSSDSSDIISQTAEGAEEQDFQAQEMQLVQATPEQLAEIERTHKIQLLPGGHILATPLDDASKQDQCDSQ